MKSTLIEKLVVVADAFCAVSGQTRAAVAKAIFGRGGHLDDLAGGRRDIATQTYERALRWFADEWPAGAEWPVEVERPSALEPAE